MNLLRGAGISSALQSSNVTPLFQIRITSAERDLVIMRGPPNDCPVTVLRGSVVISLSEPILARNITLTLRGKSKASWIESFTNNSHVLQSRPMREEKEVYAHTWTLLPVTSHAYTIGVGNYEYPFSVDLPGDIQETIEGLEHGSIHYMMQAIVDRPGFSSKLITKKSIRILRTFSADSSEMAQTLSVDSTWPQKIEYAISIPTSSYPMGSSLPISFNLVPLVKGIGIAKIVCSLKEYQSHHIKTGYSNQISHKEVDRTICSTTLTDFDTDVTQWVIEQSLLIPDQLSNCVQDCEAGAFKVRHKAKFVVSISNPDGHISELRAALPVTILIPPQLFGGSSMPMMNPSDPENQLPSYDSHVYDRMYDGIATPLPSGMNTPALSRSRRNSTEAPDTDSEAHRRALVDGLSRLTSMSGSRSGPVSVSGSRSGSITPYNRSAPNSYTSAPGFSLLAGSPGAPDVEHRSYPHSPMNTTFLDDAVPPVPFTAEDLLELNRIPSYGTASTYATAGPSSRDLPQYDESSNQSTGPASGSNTPAVTPSVARPPAARTTSHRAGVLRAAHDRLTRSRDP